MAEHDKYLPHLYLATELHKVKLNPLFNTGEGGLIQLRIR